MRNCCRCNTFWGLRKGSYTWGRETSLSPLPSTHWLWHTAFISRKLIDRPGFYLYRKYNTSYVIKPGSWLMLFMRDIWTSWHWSGGTAFLLNVDDYLEVKRTSTYQNPRIFKCWLAKILCMLRNNNFRNVFNNLFLRSLISVRSGVQK